MTKEEKREYNKQYRENNKEKLTQYAKEYKQNNKEQIKKQKSKNYENNKELIKEKAKQYRENNKEIIKQYRENNKYKIREKQKEYRENNKDYFLKKNKEWRNNNMDYFNKYEKNRKQTNPLFKLKCNLRSRISIALKNKNYIKSKRTLDMLGCDLDTAKAHLEKQFTKGMTWTNHGEWHIDHIIPCALAKTEEELIKLFHYTNLQPLWAFDNLSKRDKIIEKQLFLL